MTAGAFGLARSDPGYYKAWYAANQEKVLDYLKRRRDARHAFAAAVKLTAGCADCGYREHAAALDFDHVGDDKADNVGWLCNSASWERLVAEIEKCEVVCANCHRVRTVTRRGGMDYTREQPYRVWQERRDIR